ncbi:MAG: efflux RND transporter periplasmic adaptor subunit [Blastocatellia bacterium]|nr:efflux RND transporter periplasmic adaptor subunit [Blastocatellia bacterium]
MKKLRIKHLVIILFIAVLLGVLGFRIFQAVKSESQQNGGRPGGSRMQTVQTGVVSRGTLAETITLTGPLRAKEQVDVNPKVSGRIVQMKVDTGQVVKEGSLIALIEDAEIQEQVERSKAAMAVSDATISQRQAELNNAKAELDRKQKLLDEGLISRQEFETAETRHHVSKSQLELARAQKRQAEAEQRELTIRQGQTRIFSPMTGIIAKRHVDTGAMVSPTVPIVTVVNLDTMVLHANASERDIARIKRGSPAKVIIDSLPGQEYSGRVMRISPLLDPQTRNGEVEIEIANRDGSLKGEMFARVELDLGTSREMTLLPRDALVYRGDQPGVYIVESDEERNLFAKFRPVETGLTQEDKVEVISGLEEGDRVITGGSNLVKDGDRVNVMGDKPDSNSRPQP